jgi:hypothetical protein
MNEPAKSEVAAAEQKIGLYRSVNFPYVAPSQPGYPGMIAEVDAEQYNALRAKVLELGGVYESYKEGRAIPGMDVFAADQEALDALREAANKAKEAYRAAKESFAERREAHIAEVAAEQGKDAAELYEASKREGQRIVCAAMAEAFPDVFANHPKYQNVAAGTPVAESGVTAAVILDTGGDAADAGEEDPDGDDGEEKEDND